MQETQTPDTPIQQDPPKPHQKLVDYMSDTYYEGGKKDEIRAKVTSDPEAFEKMLNTVYKDNYAESGVDYESFKSKYLEKEGNPFEVKKKDAAADVSTPVAAPPTAPSGESGPSDEQVAGKLHEQLTTGKPQNYLSDEEFLATQPNVGPTAEIVADGAPEGTVHGQNQSFKPTVPFNQVTWESLEQRFAHTETAKPAAPQRKAGERDDVSWGRAAIGQANRTFYEIGPAFLESISMASNALDDFMPWQDDEIKKKEVKDYLTYKTAQQLRDWIHEVNPMQADQEHRFDMQVIGGVTQGLQLIIAAPTRLATGGLLIPEAATVMQAARPAALEATKMMYSRSTALPAMTIASQEFRDAKAKGASDEVATGSALFNAVASGGLEQLGPMLILRRLNNITKGGVTQVLKDGLVAGSEEAMTEVLQQYVSNMNARNTYDHTRQLTEGIVTSGEVGGASGFVLNTLMAALGGKLRATRSPREIAQIKQSMEYLQQQINLQQRETTLNMMHAPLPDQIDPTTTVSLDQAISTAQAQVATAPTTETKIEQAEAAAEEITIAADGNSATRKDGSLVPIDQIPREKSKGNGWVAVTDENGKVTYKPDVPKQENLQDRMPNLDHLLEQEPEQPVSIPDTQVSETDTQAAFDAEKQKVKAMNKPQVIAAVNKDIRGLRKVKGIPLETEEGVDRLVEALTAFRKYGNQELDQTLDYLIESAKGLRHFFSVKAKTDMDNLRNYTNLTKEQRQANRIEWEKTNKLRREGKNKFYNDIDNFVQLVARDYSTEPHLLGNGKATTSLNAKDIRTVASAPVVEAPAAKELPAPVAETDTQPAKTHPVQVGKQKYQVGRDADGAVQVLYEDGSPVSKKSKHYKTAVETYKQERLQDFVTGKEADMDGVQSDDEATSAIIHTSENPAEVAAYWLGMPDGELDHKQQVIRDHLRPTTQESYRRNGDVNQQEGRGQIRLNYIRPDGQPLDTQAQELSEIAGVEITEADLIDFIDSNPGGQQTAKPVNQSKDKVAQRFFQLTGIEIDADYAAKLQAAYLPEGDVSQRYAEQDPAIMDIAANNDLFLPDGSVDERAMLEFINQNPNLFPDVQTELTEDDLALLTSQTNEQQSENNTENTRQPEPQPAPGATPDPKPTAVPKQAQADRKEAAKQRIKENVKALGNDFLSSLTDTSLGIAQMPEQRARELYETHRRLVQIASDALTVGHITVQEFADSLGAAVNNLIKGAYRTANGEMPGATFDEFKQLHSIVTHEELANSRIPDGNGHLTPKVDEDTPDAKRMKILDRVANSDQVSQKIKNAVQRLDTGYIPRGLELSTADAAGLINALGVEVADAAVRDMGNGITGDTRVAVAAALFEEYSRRANAKSATAAVRNHYRNQLADITLFAAQLTNSAGRTVNAAKLFKQLLGDSPEAAAIAVEKEVRRQQQAATQPIQGSVTQAGQEVQKTFEQTVAEAVSEVLGRGFTPKPTGPSKTTAREKINAFFDKLRIKDTSTNGKILDASSVLYYLGAKVYNAGLDVVQKAIVKGWDVAQAVVAGADVIDKLQNGQPWSRQDFINDLTQQLGGVVSQIKQQADVESVADQVARRTMQYVSDSEAKKDAVMMAINSLMGKVRDKVKPGQRTPITDLEKLTFAIENRDALRQEWDEAMNLLVDRITENEQLTDNEKLDLLNKVNDAVNSSDPRMHAKAIARRLLKEHLAEKTGLTGQALSKALDELALGISEDGAWSHERAEQLAKEMVIKFGIAQADADALALSLTNAYGEEMRARQQRLRQKPEVVAKKELDWYLGKENVHKKITELAKAYYAEPEAVRGNLAERIMEDPSLFLSRAEAQQMADAIQQGFDTILQNKKDSILNQLQNKLNTPKVAGKKKKTMLEKALELANLGALDEARWNELYAEALGIKPLSTQDKQRIFALSAKVQEAQQAEKAYVANPSPQTKADYETRLHAAEIATVQLQEYMAKERSAGDLLIALIQGNTLTLGTQMVNLAGNITQQAVVRFPVHAGAAMLDYLISAATGKPRTVAMPSQKGYFSGAAAGHKKGARELKTGAIDMGVLDQSRALHPMRALMRVWNGESSSKIKDLLEGTFGMPAEATFRMLNYTDRIFKGGAESARLHEMAQLQGLKGVDLERFILAPDQDSKLDAEKSAREATFQESGQLSQKIQDGLNGFLQAAEAKMTAMNLPLLAAVTKAALKIPALYTKVPLNIIAYSWGQAMFPMRLLQGVMLLRQGQQREAAFQLSNGIYGAAIASLAYGLIQAGIMTAAGEKEDESRERQAGYTHHPQGGFNMSAFRRLITGGDSKPKTGDRVIKYASLGQVGMTMGFWAAAFSSMEEGAKAVEGQEQGKGQDVLDFTSEMIGALPKMGSTALEMSFAKSMNELLEGLRGGNAGHKLVSNYTMTMANAFYPSTISSISRATAPHVVDKRSYSEWYELIKAEFKVRTFQAEKLPATVNMWGEKVTPSDNGVNPYFAIVDPLKSKFLDTEHFGYKIYELFKETGDVTFLPAAPERTITEDEETHKLTPAQYEQYATIVGRYRALYVRDLIQDPEWDKMTNEEKLEDLKAAYRDALEEAKYDMLDELGL